MFMLFTDLVISSTEEATGSLRPRSDVFDAKHTNVIRCESMTVSQSSVRTKSTFRAFVDVFEYDDDDDDGDEKKSTLVVPSSLDVKPKYFRKYFRRSSRGEEIEMQ